MIRKNSAQYYLCKTLFMVHVLIYKNGVVSEIPSFINQLQYGKNILSMPKHPDSNVITSNTVISRALSVKNFLLFLNTRYLTQKYHTSSDINQLRSLQKHIQQQLTFVFKSSTGSLSNKAHVAPNTIKYKSISPKMLNAIFKIVRPSLHEVNNDNPWKNRNLQIRNYIIVKLLVEYGLRTSELLLLTIDSIKSNLSCTNFNLVITHPLDSDERGLSIKNTHSHRVIRLHPNDYKLIEFYIQNIRKLPQSGHRFIFININNENPMHAQSLYRLSKDIFAVLSLKFDGLLTNTNYQDTIDNLHPHMFRHTWATIKFRQLKENGMNNNSSSKSAIDLAKDQLRELAGWSLSSQMPSYYAKQYISELANASNIERIHSYDDLVVNSLGEGLQ